MLSIDGMTKRSRSRDSYSCLYSGENLFPEDHFFAKKLYCLCWLPCMRYQIAHVHEERGFPVKRRCVFDRRCINGPAWTLNSGLMHADYDHHVKPDNLVPAGPLKNFCTSPGIPVLMTSNYLHKCNYFRTGFVLLCLSRSSNTFWPVPDLSAA